MLSHGGTCCMIQDHMSWFEMISWCVSQKRKQDGENHVNHVPFLKETMIDLMYVYAIRIQVFPGLASSKAPVCSCRRRKPRGFHLWVRKNAGRGRGNPLQYSCLENPWSAEPGGLQSMGSCRVGHDRSNLACMYMHMYIHTRLYDTKTAWKCA